jgi:hypothetical protein
MVLALYGILCPPVPTRAPHLSGKSYASAREQSLNLRPNFRLTDDHPSGILI